MPIESDLKCNGPTNDFFWRDFRPPELILGYPSTTTSDLGPDQLLAAVEGMSPAQRHRLATLLGIEVPHPTLCLPGRDGSFIGPIHAPIKGKRDVAFGPESDRLEGQAGEDRPGL